MKNRVEKSAEIVKKIETEEKKEKFEKHTKKFIKFLIIFMVIIFCIFYYMRFVEVKMLFVKEVKIESVKIPKSLSGFKIVHFSDLHYNMTTSETELKKLVNEINDLEADVLVFTGDLLDSTIQYKNKDYETLTKYLKMMEASNVKYYIKGNHDYKSDEVDSIFYEANFISINNRDDYIYGNGTEKIYINGMGSFIKDDFDSNNAFLNQQEGIFTLSLFHEPDNVLELSDRNIDLALAGHSHNNQVNIPVISNFFKVEGAKTYYENFYQINDTYLYVNSGIGTSVVKLRLFAPPTINLYRLVSKET